MRSEQKVSLVEAVKDTYGMTTKQLPRLFLRKR